VLNLKKSTDCLSARYHVIASLRFSSYPSIVGEPSVLTINLPSSEYFQEINCHKINYEINNKMINQYKNLLINKELIKNLKKPTHKNA
jgi:hypothetical protein